MIPYADFTYFVLLLYVAVPTIILGLFGRAGWRWALLVTVAMLVAQYQDVVHLRAHFPVREIWLVLTFALWQWLTVRAFASAGARAGWLFYSALGVSLLPLAITKVLPVVSPKTQFGFLGISYVTFRALDIVFCLRDGVIETPGMIDLFMFLFFFPRFRLARSTVIAVSFPTGEKGEAALSSWLISTVPCTTFFVGYSTSSYSLR